MKCISAAIVHRHGARLPNIILPGDLNFPSHFKFWNRYNATLIPIGVKQTRRLGKSMRYRYSSYLKDKSNIELASIISARTSNTQRSIMSCISFIDGLLPFMPHHLAFDEDHSDESYEKAEKYLRDKGRTMGIQIHIECGIDCESSCSIFHKHKFGETHKKWRDYNTRKSPFIQSLSENPKYIALADKLYQMTKFEEISPEKDPLERIIAIKIFNTHLRIADCQHSEPLSNDKELHLNDDEKTMIFIAANAIYSHMFQPYTGLTIQEIGSGCVGQLLQEIVNQFEKSSEFEFCEFSAHDTTILAIASVLGITIDSPNFTGYFLFEKYEDGNVGIFYNPEPSIIDQNELKFIKIEIEEKYVSWKDLQEGMISWEDFKILVRGRGPYVRTSS